MKALVCSEFAPLDNLRIEEIEPRALDAGEVRIAVAACGINFPDILLAQGKYQVKPPLPFFPGGEVAGTICELGPGVAGLAIGERVMATIFWGGMAEQAVAQAEVIVRVPDGMDLISAAVFQGGHTTSYYALKQRAALAPGETLLVLGAGGGVGMAALQLGRAMGARVIAAVGSAAKAQVLRSEGFEEVIDYGSGDLREAIKELTAGKGVDVVYDPVGGELFEPAARSLCRKGRILVVGFASGEIPKYPVNLALLKETAVVGVNYQQFFRFEREEVERNFAELMEMHAKGLINPRIDRVYPLAQAVDALKAVAAREIVGKAVVRME